MYHHTSMYDDSLNMYSYGTLASESSESVPIPIIGTVATGAEPLSYNEVPAESNNSKEHSELNEEGDAQPTCIVPVDTTVCV